MFKDKNPDAQLSSNPVPTPPRTTKVQLPTPRTFNGKKYYGTDDVAKIIGVTRRAVSKWQNELYFGCPLFAADERAHDGRYLYEVERVMQLASVYHPNWMRGGYEPSPTTAESRTPRNALQMRRFEDVVQDLKRVSLNELIARGILEPAANFNSGSQTGLCCPFCNSGRGDNHTGAGQFNNDNTFFCHACQNDDNGGKSLSTIDLYMHARNISDFKDAVSQMAQEFSVSTRDFLSSRSTEKKSARHDKNINPELLGIVREDIRRAQADLDELPADQCRCLTPETMKHFGFGFLSDWLHPNHRLSNFKGNKPSPTRRLIIPTSDKHYNAVLLDCDRNEQNKSVWKQHTAGIELFNETALTSDSDIIVAVEGEVDAASIWQASGGNIAVVGVIGGNKNLLLNAIDKLHVKDKKFLILFDNDAGQDNARRLLDALTNAGYPAVSKIFDDAIPADGQKFFTRKIDANEILKVKGNEFLHQLTNQIISDARADLSNRKTLDAGKTAKVQFSRTQNDGLSFSVSDSIKPETTRQERIDSMDELITTREAAEILGVSRSTLENWRTRKLFGCYFFSADEMHGKTWYYRRERIEQLKSVYHKGILQNIYRISRISFKRRPLKEIEVLTYSNPDEKVRRFYTSDEVADIFGVDESAVRYWRRTGILVEDILDHNDEYLYSAEKIENFTPPAERKAAAPADKDLSESQSPTHDEDTVWTQGKITTCPINLRLPQNYLFNFNGITLHIPTRKKTPKKVCVSRTAIVPTKLFREPTSHTVQYEIAYLDYDVWRTKILGGELLGDPRSLSKTLQGWGVLVEDSAALKNFFNQIIAENADVLPRIKAYNKTGWVSDDCEEFVYPHKDADYIVKREGYDFDKIFKPKGDPELWRQKFVEVTDTGGAVAHVVIGTFLAACAIRPLGLPNLQLNIEGNRNIGKTPLLMFGASIFGDPRPGRLTRTFSATPKNRVELATAFCDLPLVLNELETLGTDDTRQLVKSIYDYSYGVCNQAQKRNGTAREAKEFFGTRLSAGEHAILKPTDKSGAFKRALNLYAKELLPEALAAELHTFTLQHCGLFGWQWIKYVTRNIDVLRGDYQRARKFISKLNNELEPQHVTHIAAALVFYQCFKECINLQNMTADEEKIGLEILNDVQYIVSILPTQADLDDATRAIAALSDYVAGHERYFAREVDDKPQFNFEFSQQAIECYGKIFQNGEVAFLRGAIDKILEKELGFASADKLIKEFFKRGLLRHDGNHITYPTYFNNKYRRMIRFKADILTTAESKSFDDTTTDKER